MDQFDITASRPSHRMIEEQNGSLDRARLESMDLKEASRIGFHE